MFSDDDFDNAQIYSTMWLAPHHDHLDFGEAPRNWEASRGGEVLAFEMAERGLTASDLVLRSDGYSLIAGLPLALGVGTVLIAIEQPSEAEIARIRRLLDAACANIARERMMRATGWSPGEPEPAWSLLTTGITEHVLGLFDYTSYDLWSLPPRAFDETGCVAAPQYQIGDARDALPPGFRARRLGPLLRLGGTVEGGFFFQQHTCTRVFAPEGGVHVPRLSRTRPYDVADFGDPGTGPIASYIGRLEVTDVLPWPKGKKARVLQVSMPMVTMDEIPEEALRAIGITAARTDRRRPYWAVIKRLEAWTGRLPRASLH